MKLVSAKPFINYKTVKNLLITEDVFITKLFSITPIPIINNDSTGDEDEQLSSQDKEDKLFPTVSNASKRAKTFEELHSKLNELKGKKKLGYKQKLLKQNLKNKVKKKLKREERLQQKKLARTERLAANTFENADDGVRKTKVKPIFNSKGNMVFSKFDFSDIGTAHKRPHKVEKDPKKILEKIEEKNQKIQELVKEGDVEKAIELKEKDKWKSALAKASGEKVKDDPTLLKKTIKKEEQLKNRSKKKWVTRTEKVQKTMDERQQKRQENIMKRKRDKKNNKLKKASKKGRIIPGF